MKPDLRSLAQALVLALKDYRHEALLSACSICILAAVLAPLMVLLGVHHGIINAMTERLLNDPRTLEISPVGSGKYGPAWFEQIAALPQSAFVMPQTRSIAATMNLSNPKRSSFSQAVTPLIAAGAKDPLLSRWAVPEVGWDNNADPDSRPTALVILSESTGRRLGVAANDTLEGRVDRVYNGKRESAALFLRVQAVLPPEAQSTDAMFVPLELLVASEDYRDGRAVPFLGWSGDAPAWATAPQTDKDQTEQNADSQQAEQKNHQDDGGSLARFAHHIRAEREYASFRLYAKTLDDVSPLWAWFQERNIEVYVRAAEIETVQSLDRAFSIVFSLITGAALFGFCASTAGSTLAGVRRKSRSLGLMRLMGFPRSGILLFPVAQSIATGALGFCVAFILYLAVAFSIDSLFSASLPGGEAVCVLPFFYALGVFVIVIGLSAFSSLSAAWQATTIEPSEVIRDV